jgi:hypothetical protein
LLRPDDELGDRPYPVRRFYQLGPHHAAFADVLRRIENHLVAILDPGTDLKRGATIAGHREFAQVNGPVLNDGDAQAFATEDDRLRGDDY